MNIVGEWVVEGATCLPLDVLLDIKALETIKCETKQSASCLAFFRHA